MSKLPFTTFAQKLAANPHLIAEEEEATLRELLALHSHGMLDPELVEEMDHVIQTNTLAASIWREFQASKEQLTTEAGQAWLKSASQSILANVLATRASKAAETRTKVPSPPIHAFFDRLSDWMASLFPSLTLQAAYADPNEGSVVHRFDSPGSDPYRARLVRDTAGQWRLRVSTSDAEAAKLRLRLEIEEDAPVVSFVAGEPGHFLAEVLLTEEMAQALQSGHRPVFRLVE